ncbi:LysR family transcriptional regulator [Colwellia sp. 1_MG-2023]|uniref:LysR family transcriptional regulator n=1 Tax=Colwellia sp. 1_MG-2023 TaxID=3062649 RepID=UPI0026E2A503|nr:LysR family transcriptional regulator [Colwellia sp. 1_MG-2023]MDO6446236.1 LysR family transcriptional regulator [Colwellia sp. 1_MG-2023]
MKDISNEQIFVKVVESGSFKGAAELLNIDPSLVSRRVSNLEKKLNVKLMERSTKQSVPTEQGNLFFQGLKKLLEEHNALESFISGTVNTPSGHLKVTAPHDFGAEFVADVLETMSEKYSGLTVELALGSHFEDLLTQGIDVAIRVGELSDSNMICRRIGNVPRVLVASKGYIEKHGMPKRIQELENHRFIYYTKQHVESGITIGTKTIKPQCKFVINSISAIKQLVLRDKGLHLGPIWAFKQEIEAGEVVSVLPNEKYKSYPMHALYLSRTYTPAKIRCFIDLLVERYGGSDFS